MHQGVSTVVYGVVHGVVHGVQRLVGTVRITGPVGETSEVDERLE